MTELKPSFTLPASVFRPEAQVLGTALQHSGENRQAGHEPVIEKNWHQHAVRYLSNGLTYAQVADAVGVCSASVKAFAQTNLCQERVNQYIAEQDRDIMEMFKARRVDAILRLGELVRDAKSEVVQLGAIKEILDRNFGKSLQRTESDITTRSADPVAEAEQLKRDIQGLLRPASEGCATDGTPA